MVVHSQNVLKDAEFETNDKAWNVITAGTLDTEIKKSGASSFKVSQSNQRFSGVVQTIYFPNKIKRAEVSGWMKTENVNQGPYEINKAIIAVEIRDNYGNLVIENTPAVGQQIGNSEWTFYKNSYEIPARSSYLNVFGLLSNCTGTAWFDDFQVLFFNEKGDTLAAGATQNKLTRYSKLQLKMDFKEMIGYLKTHPALYEFTSKTEFDSLVNAQYSKLKDSMTIEEFYSICSPIVAKIGCSHTAMRQNFGFTSTSFLFPLKVYFYENKMYVIRSNAKIPEVAIGSEIVEINGKPVSEVYSKILNNISADGNNKNGKLWILNNYFDYYYALNYGIPHQYSVAFKTNKKEEIQRSTFKANSADPEEIKAGNYAKCKDPNLCFTILDKNTAIITVKSFVYYNRVDYFKSFVDECFQAIHDKGIDNLIIDHRSGGGGDPYCSSYLLSYILRKPVTYFTKSAQAYEDLKIPLKPANKSFKGKIYMLVDNGGFSSSGHFNALVKYHKLGTLIGQETGSTYTCNATVKNFTLNHTGLNLDVALATYSVDIVPFPKDRGIIPDIEVQPSLEDIISGRDAVMDYTLKLINKQKRD